MKLAHIDDSQLYRRAQVPNFIKRFDAWVDKWAPLFCLLVFMGLCWGVAVAWWSGKLFF